MKILFSGYHNPTFVALTEYTERALEALGHELSVFDHRRFILPGRVHGWFGLARRVDMALLQRRFLRQAVAFQPDLVLVNQGANLYPETIDKVRDKTGACMTNWFQDYPMQYEDSVRIAPHYDHFFWGDTYPLEKHRALGYTNEHWLPFACDPEAHRPVELTDDERERYGCSACFVGSMYPGRARLLEHLADCGLAIWGPGWERLPDNSPLRACLRGGPVPPEVWVKIFSAADIVLNIDGYGTTLDDAGYMANTRVYEAPACGAFQLVDEKRDITTLFESGRELVCYDFGKPEHLRELVAHYLAHPEERKRIAQQGRAAMLAAHTYQHRMQALISTAMGETRSTT